MGFSDDFIEMFRYQHFECYWRKADYSYVFTDNEKQQILSNFKNEDYISEVTGILDYKENLWADCFNQYQGNVVMACLWNPIDEHSIKAINEMKKLHVEFAPKGVEFVYVSDNIQMAYNSNIRELLEYTRCTHYEWGDRQYKDFMKKFNFEAVPSFVMIGKNGDIIDYHSGYHGNEYYEKKIGEELRK
jgi:hypothetical protein